MPSPPPLPRVVSLAAVGAYLLAACLFSACRRAPAPTATAPPPPSPQQYAWTLLARVSRPGPSTAVTWESWDTPGDVLHPSSAPSHAALPSPSVLPVRAPAPRPCALPTYVVAHLNPDEVRYIQTNQLTTVAGLRQWFAQGRAVDFPPAAISLKAVWKVLDAADNPSDYLLGDFGGVRYGLQGINLAAKAGANGAAAPQWFWASFENIRNRCYWSSAYRQPDGFGFPDGQHASPGLQALLAQNHLDPSWRNYRLVGIQADSSVRLGNSVIEANLPTTSSCLACHSESRFNSTGAVLPPLPFTGDAGPLAPITPPQLAGARQLDFVWAFLCLASPTATCQSLPDAGGGH